VPIRHVIDALEAQRTGSRKVASHRPP
jgi:hypothetical protein